MKKLSPFLRWLLLGDLLALTLVTVLGFATHGTLGSAGVRLWATFIPLLAGWVLVGATAGLFDFSLVTEARQLWRPVWAMILVAPFTTWFRAWWLGIGIPPVFIAVLAATGGLGMLLWRALFWGLWKRQKKVAHG